MFSSIRLVTLPTNSEKGSRRDFSASAAAGSKGSEVPPEKPPAQGRARRRPPARAVCPAILDVEVSHDAGKAYFSAQFSSATRLRRVLERFLAEASPAVENYHLDGYGYRYEFEVQGSRLKLPVTFTLRQVYGLVKQSPLRLSLWVIAPPPSR